MRVRAHAIYSNHALIGVWVGAGPMTRVLAARNAPPNQIAQCVSFYKLPLSNVLYRPRPPCLDARLRKRVSRQARRQADVWSK